jgi:peptidoglycan/xylan/chitin deacetylase (PgdA/CDA1 family)
MMRLALQVLSPAGARARLSVLIFHRVLPEPDPLFPDEIDAARFAQVCAWARQWFQVLPLAQAVQRLREGTLPARALAISFDDGYADNHDIALPILQRAGLNATFFVSTGFLGGGRMWNDTLIESVRLTRRDSLDLSAAGVPGLAVLPTATLEQRRAAIPQLIRACRYLPPAERERAVAAVAQAAAAALPDTLMMSPAQVQGLHRAGMGVGGHTVNHPILARLAPDEARREIEGGKAALEALLQARVPLFAYPNGRPDEDFKADHAQMVRAAGFDAAVTTAWGSAHAGTDPYQLPRFTPWDRSRWAFGLRMSRNLRAPVRLAAA